MDIKIKNKYILYKFSPETKKIKKLTDSNSMMELKEKAVGKHIALNDEIILLKLSKDKDYDHDEFLKSNKKTFSKLVGGPIKINFKMYEVNKNYSIKPIKEINSRGKSIPDKRNGQFLFITMEHYEKKGIRSKDLELVALKAVQNNLEKNQFAPKLIDQIY